LDKRRSGQAIQLVSYINSRNRKKNVEEAEKAIIEEARANKGMKFSDPFTRRSTKPKMAFKANQNNPDDEIMVMQEPPKPTKQKEKKAEEHLSADNLYSLHDFEIDLDVPLPTNVAALPKPVQTTQIQDSGPKVRRSLNLEDYKKKRGLI
jgi:RNA polymerase-associated protein RTF1